MNLIPRNLPRYVPTLTEIVDPASLLRTSSTSSSKFPEISQFVMQQVEQVLDRRLKEETDAMLRNWVTGQLGTLRLHLRDELALVVRNAVAEAIASRDGAQE
ncbi:MAG: hypothetical protein KJ614_13205 [Gammaproteobacteria bacterium]|uniref:hypothetical protein n=1 Tax=Rhodoferax sp. TaxID=50421 RepID=UPI0017E5F933|nr:hypothetical protein [Rhodoferax sp.]MBU3899860.1 hypothetical protein [Gammaproteobacteria bacterium]MBA3058195.1 hypothetical protein [Rhodoferax sp.]MBU3996043.1 hypothetical protein [Gammaproteobacteria bacterium]MBU4019125.1 hypothetical protein [Gammaproteobacteria bacterium]MBU4078843.1 hypothetical protein [Gammaproteobacteria bacterium]